MKQTPPHDLYNDSILSIIRALKSKSIIEVGCMRGSLAKEYLKDNSSSEWTGIDIDEENVSHAQKICHYAIRADIEKLMLSTLPNIENVDAWILGDVLEHLRDPWGLLRKIREISLSNATVIACIPNSQHWSFQVRVNSGMMQYQDEGLFDRTHLRFFSRTTIVQMFQEAGYTIKSMYSRSFDFPGFEKYLPSIRTMASLSGVDPDQAQADALAFQYVVEAVRAE